MGKCQMPLALQLCYLGSHGERSAELNACKGEE